MPKFQASRGGKDFNGAKMLNDKRYAYIFFLDSYKNLDQKRNFELYRFTNERQALLGCYKIDLEIGTFRFDHILNTKDSPHGLPDDMFTKNILMIENNTFLFEYRGKKYKNYFFKITSPN